MGILISVTGFDGTGKTTQVSLLKKYLEKEGKSVYVTERLFGYFLLKPIIKYLRKATKSPRKGPVRRNKNLLLKMWFMPAFIDVWINHFASIIPLKKKYDFVIADRFYADIWANLLYYGYLPNWAFILTVRLLPKSDLPLMLLVSPKRVLKREEDFPSKYYYDQSKIYKRLKESIKFITIDADSSKNNVFKEIIKVLQIDKETERSDVV